MEASDDTMNEELRAMEGHIMAQMSILEQGIDTLLMRIPSSYTIQQFAEITGLPVSTVLAECQSGKLQPYPRARHMDNRRPRGQSLPRSARGRV